MIEIDEIIELSGIIALLKEFQEANQYEDTFNTVLDKLTAVINKKHQLIQSKYHAMEHTIEQLQPRDPFEPTRKLVATDFLDEPFKNGVKHGKE